MVRNDETTCRSGVPLEDQMEGLPLDQVFDAVPTGTQKMTFQRTDPESLLLFIVWKQTR